MYNHCGNLFMFYRIIDANINRATEGLRCVEEYCRFVLDDKRLTETLKNIRHEISIFFNKNYEELINSRDTVGDVGVDIKNISKENNSTDVIIANIKRIQEALRVLSEYGALSESYRYQIYSIEKEIMEKLQFKKKTNIKSTLLKDKNIYLITNSDNFTNETDFIDRIALLLNAGVRLIQYREKSKPTGEIIKTGKKIRELCSFYDALFIVNDRIDVAKILGADGVHLGQGDIDINDAKKILDDDKIIGISTHKPDDAIKAQENGADYIGVGPVFKTPTKPNKTHVGLGYVTWVNNNIKIPFYAIGSVDETNVLEVSKAGATRVAVIRSLMNKCDFNSAQNAIKIFNEVLKEN